jgi:exodeoxyribonuclease VII large subunit
MTRFGLPFDDPEPPAATAAPAVPEAPAPDPSDTLEDQPLHPARHIFTVSELTADIRSLLEEQFFEVWLQGELSNCRLWNTGHLYFTLKDAGAQLRGVMFRSAVRLLKFKPQDGLHVILRGRVSVYEAKGEYQIVCEHMEPEGLGALQLAFDQVKQRLAADGLFDAARKRPLPVLPRKIGVVTSLDGAAIRDIIKVLRRRYANAHIVIRPTRVQGEGAAAEVARALAAIGGVEGVDVVIVGRGGGSIEDLWAFNEEVVARAIAACPVPTISAVGHESDVTIADFVADLRAPTPSAAAEMVVMRKDEVAARIDRLSQRVAAAARARLHRLESRLRTLDARGGYAGFSGRLAMRGRHVGELTHELRRVMRARLTARERTFQALRLTLESLDQRRRLAQVRARLTAADAALAGQVSRQQFARGAVLGRVVAKLESLSPLAVLGRGYAVCWNADRTVVVRDAAQVQPGDHVHVTLEHGHLDCEVQATAPDVRTPAREA